MAPPEVHAEEDDDRAGQLVRSQALSQEKDVGDDAGERDEILETSTLLAPMREIPRRQAGNPKAATTNAEYAAAAHAPALTARMCPREVEEGDLKHGQAREEQRVGGDR